MYFEIIKDNIKLRLYLHILRFMDRLNKVKKLSLARSEQNFVSLICNLLSIGFVDIFRCSFRLNPCLRKNSIVIILVL